MTLVLPRRSLNLDFVRDGQASGANYPDELSKLDSLLTFARASTATRFNAAGVLETVAAGQPRFDFDPVTLACKGLLIEEARTNYAFPSKAMTSWSQSGALFTNNNTTSPDATLNAATLAFPAVNDFVVYSVPMSFTAGDIIQVSLWLKGTPGETVMYEIGPIGGVYPNAYIVMTAAWTRYNLSIAAGAGGTTFNIYLQRLAGTTATSIKVWQLQVEKGAFASSDIVTTTAAVTRAAESCYTTQFAPWFNATQGAFISEAASLTNDSAARIVFDLSNGTWNERLVGYSDTAFRVQSIHGGSTILFLTGAAIAVGQSVKVAASYSAPGVNAWIDGATNGAASPSPSGFSRLDVGCDHVGTESLNGHLKRLCYLPYATSGTLLKALST